MWQATNGAIQTESNLQVPSLAQSRPQPERHSLIGHYPAEKTRTAELQVILILQTLNHMEVRADRLAQASCNTSSSRVTTFEVHPQCIKAHPNFESFCCLDLLQTCMRMVIGCNPCNRLWIRLKILRTQRWIVI